MLTVNGKVLSVADVDPHMSVLDFLRARALVGTKEGCAEGECGACAVILVRPPAEVKGVRGDRAARYVPVNSCLTLVGSVLGSELLTVEGLRPKPGALHPVQKAMIAEGGSQCGYCTPGFVVSMFAEYYRSDRPDWDPESLAGNLCRCTGYRPIKAAMLSLAGAGVEDSDRFLARLRTAPPTLASEGLLQLRRSGDLRTLLRPTSLDEALTELAADPETKVVAGGTDVVVQINQSGARWAKILALEAVSELQIMTFEADWIEIGAGVSLSDLEHRLAGALPLLDALFPLFSSRLIRNRATLGGNLANASPIGDSPPVLLALDAELILASKARGRRSVALDAFFSGYRQTVLAVDELIVAIRIPRRAPTLARFYKVSKRVLDDISTVAAGFALDLDADGSITRARLAFGGVAATPLRARDAEVALLGRPWNAQTVALVAPLLGQTFSPMDDHRGSARYRRAMVGRLFEKFLAETTGSGAPIGPRPPSAIQTLQTLQTLPTEQRS